MPLFPRLVVAWAINAGALWVANAIFDSVRIHGWAAYLIGSAVLGVANAILKPLLAVLTLPLILVTLGFFRFALEEPRPLRVVFGEDDRRVVCLQLADDGRTHLLLGHRRPVGGHQSTTYCSTSARSSSALVSRMRLSNGTSSKRCGSR